MMDADIYAIHAQCAIRRPAEVKQDGGDRYWYRDVTVTHPATGEMVTARRKACEDCWVSIPPYVNNPGGFVSPESDCEIPSRKTRSVTLGSRADGTPLVGVETIPRAVCRGCYLAAFHRMYQQAPPQAVSDAVRSDDLLPEPAQVAPILNAVP